MSGHSLVEILVSLLPVFVFLVALVFLDSYKLLPLRSILLSILIGALVAAVAYGVNHFLFQLNVISPRSFSLYVTPVVEELLKSIYLIYLIRRKRIGFMVDGAIHGFAIGAGFSLVENLYYLQTLASQNILLWIIRGFGTAIMHGGVTAIVGIATSEFSNRLDRFRYTAVAPGLFAAILIHALYNFFLLPPVVSTLILMIALPILIVFIFQRSEKTTRSWLGAGFDMDVDLLQMILSGNLPDTKLGNYFRSLQDHFPGEIIADMICFLRIHLELSIRAKGVLLMREHGFAGEPSKDIRDNFTEMAYLQKSIGRIGYLALAPLLHRSSRDLWQIHMLDTL